MRRALATTLVLLLAAVLVATGGCAGSKKERQMAVIAISTNPTTLDPAATASGVDAIVWHQRIYEYLAFWKPGEATPTPQLAERWEVLPDGKTWTFYLRKGVKFHDGTPFNAEAVKWNIDRQIVPGHPGAVAKMPMAKMLWGSVDRVVVVDEYTLQIVLKQPYAPLLANLCSPFAAIISPTAYMKDPQGYGKHPVGTGPFKFESWQPDASITLVRNDQWWDAEGESKQGYPFVNPAGGRRPYLDGIVFKVIPNLTVQTEELIKGNVHWLYNVSTDDVKRLQENPSVVVQAKPWYTTGYVGFNVTQKPFNDVRVRKAIAMAINKKAIIDTVFGGWMVPAKSLIMPGMLGYPADLTDHPYDPEQARKLLAEAGYPKGFKTELWTHTNPRTTNPKGAKLAEALQPMLAAIGIDAQIRAMEWASYLEALNQGTPGLFTFGWGSDNFDPDNTAWWLLSSENIPAGNKTRFSDPHVDDLLKKAQQESDSAKRAAMYQEVERIVHDQVPLIPLNHTYNVDAASAPLKGHVAPIGDRPGYWWLESPAK